MLPEEQQGPAISSAMEETYLLNVEGVKKKILHGGYGQLPDFKEGSKIIFHFQTLMDNFERTVIDDSREFGIPMEIIVGKMFKIEVWETLLTSMRIGEVAEFWCDPVHTGMYALVSKSMRKIAEGKDPLEGQKHRCGMGNMFDYHSTGYTDLDELLRTPQALIFIMELFKVEDPSAYKRDTWAMNREEKLAAIPKLHTEGNRLVLARKFKEAAEKYQEAVICLRNIQAKEKPWEEEWLQLEKLATPLVLNYCQCQLELGEYYEVLEHTTDLLQKDNENVKAYFKRAKAHAAVWNDKEARTDFLRAAQLDPSLAAAVRKELKLLGEKMRQKCVEERKRYKEMFDWPVSKGETEMGTGEETKWLSKGHEEVLDNKLGAPVEESRPEVLKTEREVDWQGVGEKDGETGQRNCDEEETGELIRNKGEMDEEDSALQTEQGEMVTKTGDEEQESQAQQKDPSYSGEEKARHETGRPNQQFGFGEWEPKDPSSSWEKKTRCETSSPNQQLQFGECEPKDPSSSWEEKASCETSRPNQQLGFEEWEPKEEQEKAEDTITFGAQEQNGRLGFATLKEQQGKLIHRYSGKEAEGTSEHFLFSTGDMFNQGCYEAKGSFLGAEREDNKAIWGNGETQAGEYSRPLEDTGWAADNVKEWGGVESSEEIFEEDFFTAPQEGSQGEVRVTTDLGLTGESSPDWWDCAELREETSTAEKGEHRAKIEWEGEETETDDHSSPMQEIHGYENGCCPEHHETGTEPKERVTGTETHREGIQDESSKREINLGGEFSWEQRGEFREEADGWVNEKTNVECIFGAQEERPEDGVGLGCPEDEMCFNIEKFKVGMGEQGSVRDQDKEDFHWEWPENTGGITHLSLKEDSLSPWSCRDAIKDEGGDPDSTRGKDTSQACCSLQLAEPGVKSVPNVWATKQPSPVEEEALGNRE
ncbi:uncharacterized protein LOC125442604 [Sphaerodactylus townsendi]|uniref:Uncharacterized protein n=1 Tax=Sphaerodactylus townsendi TaxID=933632 RepID=A0ACB8FXD6_9SAUR|nr:uncharacterized protein LOC125442604 [Sphaerodactylus townsendi]